MDVVTGITTGVLRLGIAQGDYVAYIEVAGSGIGSRYWVARDGVCLSEGSAPDLPTAKQKAEEELRVLCSAPLQ
jgi:hypothetical protein